MICPECGYLIDALDQDCPRCKNLSRALAPKLSPGSATEELGSQATPSTSRSSETKSRITHRSRIRLAVSAGVLALIGIVVFHLVFNSRESAAFAPLREEYGIDVCFIVSFGFFPTEWRQPPINARATPISRSELQRFPTLLRLSLAKYPKVVISKHLTAICLAKEMYFYDTPYGGTNSGDVVYLCSEGEEQGYTDDYLINSFHHEFSSILMRSHPFPSRQWRACNAPGFKYTGSDPDSAGRTAITQNKADLAGSEELYRAGFLSQYSTADIEEDFNMFSGLLLSRPRETRTLIQQYPRLKKKYEVWLAFYRSINNQMTETFLLQKPVAREQHL